MKKVMWGTFVFFDVAVIGTAGFVLYSYLSHKVPAFPELSKTGSAPIAATPAPAAAPKPSNNLLVPPAAPDSGTRKILFKYSNGHARQVSIRADFTGWKGQPMQKAANGTWTYLAQLTPGEYAYCFTADDKTFKDPSNKRTKLIGRTKVSAILVEAKPAK